MDDDLLLAAAFGPDEALARKAVELFAKRHPEGVAEPTHCAECFEGCPKCQPKGDRP